jgi:hypothetical protein
MLWARMIFYVILCKSKIKCPFLKRQDKYRCPSCMQSSTNGPWIAKICSNQWIYSQFVIAILQMNAVYNLQKKYWAVLSGSMYAYYFSVYTSIYLCCSFWYRFESSLLIKGSLVCFRQRKWSFSKWDVPKVDKVFISGFYSVETF